MEDPECPADSTSEKNRNVLVTAPDSLYQTNCGKASKGIDARGAGRVKEQTNAVAV